MKVIHVLRKPCSEGTVAANVLRHGTGAINIDACRIGFQSDADLNSAIPQRKVTSLDADRVEFERPNHTKGRWPANLIFHHLDGCTPPSQRKEHQSQSWVVIQSHDHNGSNDSDGTKTVMAWECAPGCPVASFDTQTGNSKSSKGTLKFIRSETSAWRERGGSYIPGRTCEVEGYGDSGGASRFFKQFGREDEPGKNGR